MNETIQKLLKPLASLKLTVALLAMSIVLVFAATWEQIDYGIWTIVEKYFRSFFVWIRFQIFLPRGMEAGGGFPWPGGYLIGPLLLANLVAAHSLRFKVKALGARRIAGVLGLLASTLLVAWFHRSGAPEDIFSYRGDLALLFVGAVAYAPLLASVYVLFEKRTGIVLIHVSIIMLLVGELMTGVMALETQMLIYEGQTVRHSHDIRECELAIIEKKAGAMDRVVSVPQRVLENAREPIVIETLPFAIRVDKFMGNAGFRRAQASDVTATTRDFGRLYHPVEKPEVSGVAAQQTADTPASILTVLEGGREIGTFVVSALFISESGSPLFQSVSIDGREFELALRFRRHYKPYSMHLIDFSHDVYTGTTIPKNFSSQVHLVDPSRNQDRDVLISMNRPLRYHGETFFQSSFTPDNRGTVLQVVTNPGRHLPYIACALGGIGLTFHFSLHLMQFLKRKRT